jgi:hypothetical protein
VEVPKSGDARRMSIGDVRPLALSDIWGAGRPLSSVLDMIGDVEGDNAGKRAATLDGDASELSGVCATPTLRPAGLLATGGGPGFGAAICFGVVPIDSYIVTMSEIELRLCALMRVSGGATSPGLVALGTLTGGEARDDDEGVSAPVDLEADMWLMNIDCGRDRPDDVEGDATIRLA